MFRIILFWFFLPDDMGFIQPGHTGDKADDLGMCEFPGLFSESHVIRR